MKSLSEAKMAFTYDDFVLVPQRSLVRSRKYPDISTSLSGSVYEIPIISAPMNTITEENMLVTMGVLGGVGVIHRFIDKEKQLEMVIGAINKMAAAGITNPRKHIYVAVGANGDAKDRIKLFSEHGIVRFCVDVANGHNIHCINSVREIIKLCPSAEIMAGNVVSLQGAEALLDAGAKALRVGVGSGAVCTTRMVTGHGLPQLSAIEECAEVKEKFPDATIIADGGITKSGDIVKALAIGADAVMIGSLLAGCKETPGEFLEENDRLYKYYHGMASEAGRQKWMSRQQAGTAPEGVSRKVPYVGREALKIIMGLCDSLKVGMSYSGAKSISELQSKAVWRRVTGAGFIEGTPHAK